VKEKISLGYKAVKAYFYLMIEGFYYRRHYYQGVENIPPEGTPLLMVSDHQNCLNDALGVLLAVKDRKMRFIARADAFEITPLFTKFLLWVGLRPAFRLMHQGEEQLGKNQATFQITEENLRNGHSILIYPEAGHQTRRWLGFFSHCYLRTAFHAAGQENYEKDIFILPSCNHYSNYNGLRNDILIRFGKPISLAPYYALYKERPRTACRAVNKEVRARIRELMLDISDLPHYDDIDYLRESRFGKDFARFLGKDPEVLPEKLDADRELVARIAASEIPFEEVRSLREDMQSLGLEDRQFDRRPTLWAVLLQALLLLVTLPLAVLALWPSLLAWVIPQHFSHKMEDNMFEGTFMLPIDILVILPLSFVITLLVEWHWIGAWSLVHACALPALCVFEWYWCRLWNWLRADLRFLKAGKRTQVLKQKREMIFTKLKTLLQWTNKK
jgi:hypothetical protein